MSSPDELTEFVPPALGSETGATAPLPAGLDRPRGHVFDDGTNSWIKVRDADTDWELLGGDWFRAREREAVANCGLSDGEWTHAAYDFPEASVSTAEWTPSQAGSGALAYSIARSSGIISITNSAAAGTYILYNSVQYVVRTPGTNKWFMYGLLAIPTTPSTNTRSKIEIEAGAANKRIGVGVYGDGTTGTTKYIARVTGTGGTTDVVSTVSIAATYALLRMWFDGTTMKFQVDNETAQTVAQTNLEAGDYYWRFGQDQAGAGNADTMYIDAIGFITTRH